MKPTSRGMLTLACCALCISPLRAQSADAARRSLLAADSALARAVASTGNEAYTAALLPAAVILPARADMLHGASEWEGYLAQSQLYRAIRWSPVRGDVSADGKTGYTLDFGEVTRADAGPALHLRQIAFWRRDAGGHWRVEALMPGLYGSPSGEVPAGFGTPWGAAPRAVVGAAADELLAADRAFAAAAQPANVSAAFAAWAAPTAATVSPPSWGPQPVDSTAAGRSFSLQWAPAAGGIAQSGDLGFTVGYGVSHFTNDDGTPGQGRSKYLTIWQRQPDGRWRYVADGGTSCAPLN